MIHLPRPVLCLIACINFVCMSSYLFAVDMAEQKMKLEHL